MDMTPQRIVSLLAGATEILDGLGLADRLVGISHECDYPSEVMDRPRVTRARIDPSASSGDIDRQVKDCMTGGGPLYEIDTALLASLRPELIVTQSQCEVCAVSLDVLRRAIESNPSLHGALVVSLNPTTLDGILTDIMTVGRTAGVPSASDRFVGELRGRMEGVCTTTRALPDDDRPRTICMEWIEPPMVAGNWMPDLIDIAGGRCPLTVSGQRSGYTDWSDIRSFNPEVIVVMPCGFNLDRAVAEAPVLRRKPGWSSMSAVRNGRVYAVDGNAYFNRSGPRIVDSVELLAHLIHPRRCPPPVAPFITVN